ncbi:MAG: hypothetical protein LC732_07975 [Acidobacteria bacterium]|nr:hypothetical protein [Acidobacteriota bacterium]
MLRTGITLLLSLFFAGALSAQQAPRPEAIATVAGSASLVIPAAGNVQGGNGTHFRTDLTLVNHEAGTARVAVTWIERDVASTAAPVFLEIPARTVSVYNDFVGDVLGLRESELLSNASRPAYILGMKQTDFFRANLGIVNLHRTVGQSYTVHAVGTLGSTTFVVDLAPLSMKQVSLPNIALGDFYLVVTPQSHSLLNPFGDSTFTAYGSTVDNITGDAWSSASTFGFGNP